MNATGLHRAPRGGALPARGGSKPSGSTEGTAGTRSRSRSGSAREEPGLRGSGAERAPAGQDSDEEAPPDRPPSWKELRAVYPQRSGEPRMAWKARLCAAGLHCAPPADAPTAAWGGMAKAAGKGKAQAGGKGRPLSQQWAPAMRRRLGAQQR